MPNRNIHLCKTNREAEKDAKNLDMGIGTKDIPESAKKQSIGSNIGGGIVGKVSKKNDPFRRQNFGF